MGHHSQLQRYTMEDIQIFCVTAQWASLMRHHSYGKSDNLCRYLPNKLPWWEPLLGEAGQLVQVADWWVSLMRPGHTLTIYQGDRDGVDPLNYDPAKVSSYWDGVDPQPWYAFPSLSEVCSQKHKQLIWHRLVCPLRVSDSWEGIYSIFIFISWIVFTNAQRFIMV